MKSDVANILLICLSLITSAAQLQRTSSPPSNFSRLRRQINDKKFSCILPPHPENGRWTVLNGEGKPGEKISVNTVLQFKCNTGYKLISTSSYALCNSDWNLVKIPECGKLCPPVYPTATIIPKCTNVYGTEIKCHEATDGSYLQYQCVQFYEAPPGYRKNLLCLDGSWNFPRPVCQPVCGKKVQNDALQLIYGGSVTKKFEYPWITALYRKQGDKFTNICGGSIISQRIVITAAHCVTNENGETLPKEDYQVAAGKLHNKYNDTRDTQAQYLELSHIVVHKGFKGVSQRYLADLALLVTKRSLVLNNVVQPVCINDLNNIHLHAGNVGEIAGWGIDESGRQSDELRSLKIPYKYETTCAQELPQEWANRYNTIDKMCAGFVNKSTSVCRGDSGNALVFQNPEDDRYYIHGIVSIGPSIDGECNIQQNSLYTKVAFYYEFVDRELNKYQRSACSLPPYPNNGKWTIENDDKKPGEYVTPKTILKVACNKGYKLSSNISYVKCGSSHNMPTCLFICPVLEIPAASNINCKNENEESINCNEASEGSSLSYTCDEGQEDHSVSTNTIYCLNGSWGSSNPTCQSTTTQVICGYASWLSYKGVDPEHFNASLCTHVIYSFIGLWHNGSLRVQDDYLDLEKGMYRRVTDMKKSNSKLKVLLSVGGTKATNATLFTNMASDASKRSAFVASAIDFLKTYAFDGLDIEWFYPAQNEKEIYVNLLQEVKQAFKKHGYLLSATVRPDPTSAGYNVTQISEIVDWVNVKTYDLYGTWSSYIGQNSALYSSSVESESEKQHYNLAAIVNNWLNAGMAKDKMAVTIAFFGKSFTLKDKNQHGLHSPFIGPGPGDGYLRYVEICEKYSNWTKVWDDEQKNFYIYNEDKWIGYDDKHSVWAKAAFIKKKGVFAVHIWSLDRDDVHGKCGMKQVLLNYVHGGLAAA